LARVIWRPLLHSGPTQWPSRCQVPSPSRRATCSPLNVRVPGDLVAKLRGSSVTLPIDGRDVTVRIGDKVLVSLRTKDAKEARRRFIPAFAALDAHWNAVRLGPTRTTSGLGRNTAATSMVSLPRSSIATTWLPPPRCSRLRRPRRQATAQGQSRRRRAAGRAKAKGVARAVLQGTRGESGPYPGAQRTGQRRARPPGGLATLGTVDLRLFRRAGAGAMLAQEEGHLVRRRRRHLGDAVPANRTTSPARSRCTTR